MKQRTLSLLCDSIETDKDLLWELLLDRHGPDCAGWLSGEYIASLSRSGMFEVLVPARDRKGHPYSPPLWFQLAIDQLKKWDGCEVWEEKELGARRFVVKWTKWPGWGNSFSTIRAHVEDGQGQSS